MLFSYVAGFVFSVLQGSVSEYCFHNCKTAPVIIVPGKGTTIEQVKFSLNNSKLKCWG